MSDERLGEGRVLDEKIIDLLDKAAKGALTRSDSYSVPLLLDMDHEVIYTQRIDKYIALKTQMYLKSIKK